MKKSCLPTLVLALGLTVTTSGAPPPEPKFRGQDIDTISIGYGIAIADVDGDRRPDILLADQKSFQWYHNPDWKRHLLAENLTEQDNVCLAAQDLDGDGRCEVAVGAGWNPGDTVGSGAVFYLVAPADRTQRWEPVRLHHEPTVHRMYWVVNPQGKWELVVKPLHGRGNKNNEGEPCKILAYSVPADPRAKDDWKTSVVADFTHASHNFQPINWDQDPEHELLLAAKEGVFWLGRSTGAWKRRQLGNEWAGEVRDGRLPGGKRFFATIEPMHGRVGALYVEPPTRQELWTRRVLDDALTDGHAVVVKDFLAAGSDQVVLGWRGLTPRGLPGVRLYTPLDAEGRTWRTTEISGPEVAIEDIKAADLNGDGQPDLVLAGRQTKNLRILWNESGK